MQETNEVVQQNTAATYHGHVKLLSQMTLLMVLDKSPSVPYAGRSLGGGGGNYSNIRSFFTPQKRVILTPTVELKLLLRINSVMPSSIISSGEN